MSLVIKSFGAVLAAALLLSLPMSALARGLSHEYTAHFFCGLNPGTPRIVLGEFQTSVAARNRSRHGTRVFAEVALTFPPGGPNPGDVFELDAVDLAPGQAVSLDCDALNVLGEGPPPYVQGMVTLSSRRSLDVTAVTSAGPVGGPVSTISVDQIRRR